MKYQGCLLAVKDIEVAKHFYENTLHQTAAMDIGVHVAFEGFSLQQGYAELIGVSPREKEEKFHDFQVYFETEDLDSVNSELKGLEDIKWVHEIKEYPWGQRGIRIYDPDLHVVEIAENMGVVIKRYSAQGMAVEEISKRTMYPVEAVQFYLN